jgi:hypothetical protein
MKLLYALWDLGMPYLSYVLVGFYTLFDLHLVYLAILL